MDVVKLNLIGASLEELRQRVAAEHGPEAKIISAELVTIGGIGGFLARRHYEVTVELPGRPVMAPHLPQQLRAGAGIAALLQEAEAAETKIHVELRQPLVSTDSELFTALVAELKAATGMAPPVDRNPSARVPTPASNPGDMTLVVGLGDDALRVVRSMAVHQDISGRSDAGLATAGPSQAPGLTPVNSRIDAMALRAAGVEGGFPLFVAYSLPIGVLSHSLVPSLQELGADQVWVAVDARLKHEDTVKWVAQVQSAAPIQGLAVQGSTGTASPESVNGLGLPVGWVDGDPAASPYL
jgi:hypothetical protein